MYLRSCLNFYHLNARFHFLSYKLDKSPQRLLSLFPSPVLSAASWFTAFRFRPWLPHHTFVLKTYSAQVSSSPHLLVTSDNRPLLPATALFAGFWPFRNEGWPPLLTTKRATDEVRGTDAHLETSFSFVSAWLNTFHSLRPHSRDNFSRKPALNSQVRINPSVSVILHSIFT